MRAGLQRFDRIVGKNEKSWKPLPVRRLQTHSACRGTFCPIALRVLMAVGALGLFGAGIAFSESPPSPDQVVESGPRFVERQPRYRLHLADVIEIKFRLTPDWDQEVTVQPDGFVSLMDVGDVHVLGLTLDELRGEILVRYSTFLKDPILSVKLVAFAKPYFIVGGEVNKPGRYDYLGEPTVSEAVAMAGGFSLGARTTQVYIARRVSKDTVEMKMVNVKMAQNGKPEEDVFLDPGDAIFVPRSKAGKFDRFLNVSRLYYLFRIPIY